MTTKREAALELKIRRDARSHLLPFVDYTHPNWTTGEHHKLICDTLDKVIDGKLKRVMLNAPPRGSKSETATRRMPPLFLGKYPDRQIITACYGDDLAHDMGRDVRDIIRDPWYQRLFPEVRLSADTRAAGRWRTRQGGIYVSCGLGGPIVGRGFHIGIIDDPHKGRQEADSQLQRDRAWDWYWGSFYTRRMPDLDEDRTDPWGNAAIVLMATRWHQDDLSGRLLETEGRADEGGVWTVVEIPAIKDEDTDHEQSFWEKAFPLSELRETRSKMRAARRGREWSAQYQQQPTPEEGTYLHRDWFDERWHDEPDGLRVYIASDYAVSDEGDGGDPDYTEHGVFGIAPDKRIYVLDWWYGRTESDVWIDKLLDLAAKWQPACVFGEKGQIVKSIGPYLKRRMRERSVRFRLETVASVKDKATRGRAFQAMASMREVIFPPTDWAQRIIEQAVSFPTGRYDDAFDVCSLFCSCVDKVHPGIAESPQPRKRRDRWRDPKSSESWKTI